MTAEVYQPPSTEARRLLRVARWLTSPNGGQSGLPARLALQVLIAPMTQLTFVSFDMQAFLFLVFHRRKLAVIGHAAFMTTENLFLMAWLRETTVASTGIGAIDAGLLYAAVLLIWYGSVAFAARLRAWFALTVPIVGLLYAASGPLDALFRERLQMSPLWGVAISALLVALSHGAEHFLPPRTLDPFRWTTLHDYFHAPGLSLWDRTLRALHVAFITLNGAGAEAWASLRLMHYNWLLLMMRMGYAPERYRELQDWTERAWATGQPALDFVGTGGGTFLESPDERARD